MDIAETMILDTLEVENFPMHRSFILALSAFTGQARALHAIDGPCDVDQPLAQPTLNSGVHL